MFMKSAQRGFSLVEIMVVITIIGLLSAVSLGSLNTIQKNNRDARRQADLRLVQSALQQFYADQNFYPNNLTAEIANGSAITNCTGLTGCTVITKTYLSETPKDPVTGTATPYCYRSQMANVSTGTGTNNCGGPTGACQFYHLCANLENSTSGAASCSCNAAYNHKVTPL